MHHAARRRRSGFETTRTDRCTTDLADAVAAARYPRERGVYLAQALAAALNQSLQLRAFEGDGGALGVVFVVDIGACGGGYHVIAAEAQSDQAGESLLAQGEQAGGGRLALTGSH